MKTSILLTIISSTFISSFYFIQPASAANTYYVRPDGGSATQCTGLVNAPYPGTGTSQDCAWFSYYEAMPPEKYSDPVRISGGDTLIIKKGSYMHGPSDYYNGSGCTGAGKYQCQPKPIPSGPDEQHKTKVLGEGWNAGCKNPPELWGTEKIKYVLNLSNASNIEVQCLEITDHATCGSNYRRDTTDPLNCLSLTTSETYGDWAYYGIYSGTAGAPYNTSTNVLLKNINAHGMGVQGLNAAHLTDWTIEKSKFSYNSTGGINGDVTPSKGENDAFYGTITLRDTDISWNGCIEDWKNPGSVVKCYDQQEGGYGDGLGTGPAGPAVWVLENITANYNTSDGIDLLYTRYDADSQIKATGIHVEGNAGNGLKTAADLWLENSELIGNCDFWYDKPYANNIIRCRGGGAALSADLANNAQNYIINNTFTGEASTVIIANYGGSITNWENGHHYFFNNLLQGLPKYSNPTEVQADWMYANQIDPTIHLSNSYWFVYQGGSVGRYGLCETSGTTCQDVDPLLKKLDTVSNTFDLHFSSNSSPAIGSGMEVGTLLGRWGKFNEEVRIPKFDKDGNPRTGKASFGAYEWEPFNEKPWIHLGLEKMTNNANP